MPRPVRAEQRRVAGFDPAAIQLTALFMLGIMALYHSMMIARRRCDHNGGMVRQNDRYRDHLGRQIRNPLDMLHAYSTRRQQGQQHHGHANPPTARAVPRKRTKNRRH